MFSFSCSKLRHRDKYVKVFFFPFHVQQSFFGPHIKPNSLPMERQNSSCSSSATGRKVSNTAKRCYFMSVPREAKSRCSWWNSSGDARQLSVVHLIFFNGWCYPTCVRRTSLLSSYTSPIPVNSINQCPLKAHPKDNRTTSTTSNLPQSAITNAWFITSITLDGHCKWNDSLALNILWLLIEKPSSLPNNTVLHSNQGLRCRNDWTINHLKTPKAYSASCFTNDSKEAFDLWFE